MITTPTIPTQPAPSRTALITAYARGNHRFAHQAPWVHNDPFALLLIGPQWRDIQAGLHQALGTELEAPATAMLLARSRYTEDRLAVGGFKQFVILGAGLDTFAWRRPEALRRTRVVEVDQAGPQAWKRGRVAELGLPETPNHVFVTADFQRAHKLADLDVDARVPAFFSLLGVTMYLTREATRAVLRVVAESAPRSEIVVSYAVPDECLDAAAQRFVNTFSAVAAAGGEPILFRPSPGKMESLARECGLEVADHPSHEDIVGRYFRGRADRLEPLRCERLVTLRA